MSDGRAQLVTSKITSSIEFQQVVDKSLHEHSYKESSRVHRARRRAGTERMPKKWREKEPRASEEEEKGMKVLFRKVHSRYIDVFEFVV